MLFYNLKHTKQRMRAQCPSQHWTGERGRVFQRLMTVIVQLIVQLLKSPAIGGPKIAALLALSDKVENCCWAIIELQSSELDCTTNLRQIYDRLPDHLQGKWRESAKFFREKKDGKEPTLKELSKFITAVTN